MFKVGHQPICCRIGYDAYVIAHPSKGQSPILKKVGLDPETLDSRYNKK